MSKLKRCPFCGGQANLYTIRSNLIYPKNIYYVYCCLCDIQTKDYEDKEKAIKAWNKRTKEKIK